MGTSKNPGWVLEKGNKHRGKNVGTELMDFIKNKNKTIILSTDFVSTGR